ncbi:MAG: phytase [Maricaulaceae bacterium]
METLNRAPFAWVTPEQTAAVGGPDGMVADVEGLTPYDRPSARCLVVSSQGDGSFHAFDILDDYAPVLRFRIAPNPEASVDGAQETDGLHAMDQAPPDYTDGLLIVQDGFNVNFGVVEDGRSGDDELLAPQNFKLIGWGVLGR